MNSVCLVGRLTRDPETKTSSSGTAVCSFSIAVQRDFKNRNGEYEADFVSCKAFSKTAEFVAKYLKKGSQIGVQGKINTYKWDKDGETRYGTDVIAERITFVGGAKSSGKSASDTGELPPPPSPDEYDDDLPF